VVGTRHPTADVRIFECQQVNGAIPEPALPGAHIDVHIAPDLVRQYSLLTSDLGHYSFAVKREPAGRGGSKHLFDLVRTGDLIEIGAPRNNFRLDASARHSVLVAGGIGITPIYSMYRSLRRSGASLELHYACRTRGDALFVEELGVHPRFCLYIKTPDASRSLDVARMISEAPPDAHFYCCGPRRMLDAFVEATRFTPPHRVHLERFGADDSALATGKPFRVRLAKSDRTLDVTADRSILDVLLDHGVDVAFSCREGVCGACEIGVLAGVPEHNDSVLNDKEKQEGKFLLACRSRSKGDLLVLDI